MIATIICNAVREPAAFLGDNEAESSHLSVAVSLAFECREPVNDEDPVALHREFLKVAPAAKFGLYRVLIAADVRELELITGPHAALGTPTAALAPQLLAWCEKRAPGRWVSAAVATKDSVSEKQMTASHYLASTASWAAPLPQDLGLVRTVRIAYARPEDEEQLVLVPFFDDLQELPQKLPLLADDATPDSYEFEYAAGGGFAAALGVASRIAALTPDETSLIDLSSGFLRPQPDVEKIYRTLKRIEEHGPSQLWTYSQLLAIDWRQSDADPPPADSLRRLVWRAMNGLATILDPVVLALTMAGTGPQGPFIAALLASIEEEVDNLPDAKVAALVEDITRKIKLQLKRPDEEADATVIGEKARDGLVKLLKELLNFEQENATDAQPKLLPWLLDQYVKYAPQALADHNEALQDPRKTFATHESLDAVLSDELAALLRELQSEQNVERIARTLLRKIDVNNAEKLLARFGVGQQEDYQNALGTFDEFLDQHFNGLDAARIAQATLYRSLLIKAMRAEARAEPWTIEHLTESFREARWFERRLTAQDKPTGQAFDPLREVLPVYAVGALAPEDFEFLVKATDPAGPLAQSFSTVCDNLLRDKPQARFVPAHEPLPLPVQMAVDVDTSDDEFDAFFNGVGLLVRRQPDMEWAYANLAKLSREQNSLPYELTLLPLLPVVQDQQRHLFLKYEGLPLASTDFEPTHAADDQQQARKEAFYTYTDPEKKELGSKLPLPGLAYGRDYHVAGFLQTKSAALPRGVRHSAAIPWQPADQPKVPQGDPPLFQEFKYRRTTAIGRVMIAEPPDARSAPRIGAQIDDVQPLFLDFPRVGCCSVTNGKGVLEIYRNADGTGAFTLPEDGTVSLLLSGLRWWSAGGSVTVYACCIESEDLQRLARFDVDSLFTDGSLSIEIAGVGTLADAAARALTFKPTLIRDGTPTHKDAVPAGGALRLAQSMWLRVEIEGTNPESGASLSCSDPAAAFRSKHAASRPQADTLVLLSDTVLKDCRAPYDQPVRAHVTFPRVVFNDLDRWLNNPDMLGDLNEPQQEQMELFRNALMAAYYGRHLSEALPPLIDYLPDPAVEYLSVELLPLDDQRPEGGSVISPDRKYIGLRSLLELIEGSAWGDQKQLVENLMKLGSRHAAALELESRHSSLRIEAASTDYIKINVPRGVIAQLSVRPLVRQEWLDSMFDPRMRQLVRDSVSIKDKTGQLRSYCVFEGASLVLESMVSDMGSSEEFAKLILNTIELRPAAGQRSYDIVTQPAEAMATTADALRWRRLGSMDVHTQRWRFSGRPIYSWFDPKDKPEAQAPGCAAVVPRVTRELVRFEEQAFFDRDERDVDTRRMRLLPTQTVLQSLPWEAPSATYFRHRITVRSRYAGALVAGKPSAVRAWRDKKESDDGDWKSAALRWFRAVMLGDRTRMQLTRPQLRGLIPLTSTPRADSEDGMQPTPPVLAILDERPFAHGGLADRIAAEIKTSFGYVLAQGEEEPLHIEDQRKEVGPDAHHTYTAMADAAALAAVLHAEGPVGLTFDRDAVRSPVFANTALVLHPALLTADAQPPVSLEEHRLSVALRRYLDHRWLVSDERDGDSAASTIPVDLPWWIDLDQSVDQSQLKLKYSDQDVLLEIAAPKDGDAWEITVPARRLDKTDTRQAKLITIGKITNERRVRFAVLHAPLEPGRATLSVFVIPASGDAQVADGIGNTPLMLASVEVSVPDGVTSLSVPSGARSYRTSASPVTAMNWTRTGRNFELVYTGNDRDELPRTVATDRIVMRRKEQQRYDFVHRDTDEVLHIEPSTGRKPMPLYVQRHQALLVTRLAKGRDRVLEVHDDFIRFFSRTPQPATGAHAVRVVEFETPALPLAWNVPQELERFRSAYFDLHSRLGVPSKDVPADSPPQGFSLYLRPLGEAGKKLQQLHLSLQLLRRDKAAVEPIRISAVLKPSAAILLGIAIDVFHDQLPVLREIRGGGVEVPLNDGQVKTNVDLQQAQAVEITIEGATGVNSEMWSDISLLTAPSGLAKSDPTRINYDWLFTGSRSSKPLPAEAVAEPGLHAMVEAEARIVCVSPPIPIER
jgi:hypothetical protein